MHTLCLYMNTHYVYIHAHFIFTANTPCTMQTRVLYVHIHTHACKHTVWTYIFHHGHHIYICKHTNTFYTYHKYVYNAHISSHTWFGVGCMGLTYIFWAPVRQFLWSYVLIRCGTLKSTYKWLGSKDYRRLSFHTWIGWHMRMDWGMGPLLLGMRIL